MIAGYHCLVKKIFLDFYTVIVIIKTIYRKGYYLMATTGSRIRDARKALGMTQTELAEKVGVKYSAIHKYETGLIVNLKRETISALANALNVSPAWLMCMDDDTKQDTALMKEILSPDEQKLINIFRHINSAGKKHIMMQAEFASVQEEYQKISPTASGESAG